MKRTNTIAFLLISLLIQWTGLYGEVAANNPAGDTVIIEVNENSKVIIYTKSKEDLKALNNYDFNQMIRDLNAQLTDSVEYLEIDEYKSKAYVNGKEIPLDSAKNKEMIRITLGGMNVEIDPNEVEMEEWDDDDWDDWESKWEKEEWDDDATYAKRVRRTTNHFNIDLGLNNWLDDGQFPDANNELYSVKTWGSWYVALNSVNKTWITGPLVLDWGMGVSWYNWKLENASTLILKGDERVEFVESPVAGQKSKLTASYINIHAVPMIDFSLGRKKVTSFKTKGVKIKKYSSMGFRVGMGGYAGYRLGSHSKFKNSTGDKDKESSNFYLENFRYGLRAQIGWKGVELWGTYDLNTVFFENRGPEGSNGLQGIAFGVTL